MPNPWFRMYSEILDDEKVQMMPFEMQRHLLMLFALRCQRPTEKMTESQIAFRLRVDETFLKRCKETFLDHGFIDERWSIVNWGKRQFVSDVSSSRVRKFRTKRALKQDETFRELDETQSETAPDTEQIQRAEHTTTTATQQRRGCRIPEDFVVTENHRRFAREHALISPDLIVDEFIDYWVGVPGSRGVRLDWDATFRNRIRDKTARSGGGQNGNRTLSRSVSSNASVVDEFIEGLGDCKDAQPAGDGTAGSSRQSDARALLPRASEARSGDDPRGGGSAFALKACGF